MTKLLVRPWIKERAEFKEAVIVQPVQQIVDKVIANIEEEWG